MALPACLLQAHLSLEGNSLFTLPPAVAALPALRQLDLTANMLSWLPPGPYLSALDTLILSANRLNQVWGRWAALLEVGPIHNTTQPCRAQAVGRPGSGQCSGSGQGIGWGASQHRLPTSHVLTAPSRRVPPLLQVPPVLAGASRLEVLDLSGNVGLELSRRDVHATLARMPALSLLLLGKHAALGAAPAAAAAAAGGSEWSTPSVAALVALGQALPRLQIDFSHTAAEYEGICI